MPCILVSASLWFQGPGCHANLLCIVPGTYEEMAMARSPSNFTATTNEQNLYGKVCCFAHARVAKFCPPSALLRVAKSALPLGPPRPSCGNLTARHRRGASSSTLLLDPALRAWITSLRLGPLEVATYGKCYPKNFVVLPAKLATSLLPSRCTGTHRSLKHLGASIER